MQAFKIEHFARQYPTQAFPPFNNLTPIEVERVRLALCRAASLPSEIAWPLLLQHLIRKSQPVPGVDAESDAFDLVSVVAELGIAPARQVYLSWNPVQAEIDRMAFADLARCFDWIWYPSSDDLEIFDDSFSWLIYV
jgi:hypothetical protein